MYFGEWTWPVLPAMFVYCLLVGVKTDRRDVLILLSATSILILMFVAYFAIYVISPHDLTWHVKTSMGRLVLQWWPSFLFLFFLVTAPPRK
ncbi:MAG: hypothetical protein HY268_02670 [Deltaproteobacteria bacterium]|nr:hypothetical protein [Deltaproteobacteria bacterium]